MKAVIQRVSSCRVTVEGEEVGAIEQGLLVLLGVESGDTEKDAEKLAAKMAVLRIFTDENDKMNLSVQDVQGGILVVSNFTLCANSRKGRRPSFEKAAAPAEAERLYEYCCRCLAEYGVQTVEKGRFGADMKVSLLNDGPVTIILDSHEIA